MSPSLRWKNQHFLRAAGYLFILANIFFSLKKITWSCGTFPYYFKGLNVWFKSLLHDLRILYRLTLLRKKKFISVNLKAESEPEVLLERACGHR